MSNFLSNVLLCHRFTVSFVVFLMFCHSQINLAQTQEPIRFCKCISNTWQSMTTKFSSNDKHAQCRQANIWIVCWLKTPLNVHPDCILHGVNMGPTWVLSAPDGPHVGPMNLAIRVYTGMLFKTIPLPLLHLKPTCLKFYIWTNVTIADFWVCICRYFEYIFSLLARFMGPVWAHLVPTGRRWVPCGPHQLCYLGSNRRGKIWISYWNLFSDTSGIIFSFDYAYMPMLYRNKNFHSKRNLR